MTVAQFTATGSKVLDAHDVTVEVFGASAEAHGCLGQIYHFLDFVGDMIITVSVNEFYHDWFSRISFNEWRIRLANCSNSTLSLNLMIVSSPMKARIHCSYLSPSLSYKLVAHPYFIIRFQFFPLLLAVDLF